MSAIDNDWLEPLSEEFKKPYYRKLYNIVNQEYRTRQIFPPAQDLFKAFHMTPLHEVKVVILGQDPYHEPGQAEGMSFSVQPGVEIPPSLVNIYKELHDDLGLKIPNNGHLEKWAKEGVFLLNTVLTVRAHQAFSHRGIGWEEFTDAAIRAVDREERPIVFMLWGRPAQEKEKLLTPNPLHLVLKAPHPSPLSAYRGFFGCHHFSKCNAFLEAHGEKPIDWQIEDI
jgi:uracil-DNA glycosylase